MGSAKRTHERQKALVRKLKAVPCADCGIMYPYYVMQFDHVRGEKSDGVARLVFHASTDRILAEVAKCEVVCSNCHAERTDKRKRPSSTTENAAVS